MVEAKELPQDSVVAINRLLERNEELEKALAEVYEATQRLGKVL